MRRNVNEYHLVGSYRGAVLPDMAVAFLLHALRSFYKFIFPAIIIVSAIFRRAHINDDMVIYFHSLSVISYGRWGWSPIFLSRLKDSSNSSPT